MDVNTLVDVMEEYKNKKTYGRTFVTALKHLHSIRKLRGFVKKLSRAEGFSENGIKYIQENFPKLEQIMLEDIKHFARLKNVKTVHGESVYCLAFSEYVRKMKTALDSYKLFELFGAVNSLEKSTLLHDSESFPLYMRAGICREICRFYTDKKLESFLRSEGRLTNLFVSLDEVLGFDNEDCVKTNKTEMQLLKDRVYSSSTVYTKQSIRKNLAALAKRHKITELEYACSLVSDKDNFTGVLCDKPFGGQVYIVLHIFMTVLFTFFLCILSPVFLLALVPVYRCVKLVLDRFFSRFVVESFTEPALELEKIPEACSVLVTVTTLLTGKENDNALFERLEKMFYSNGGENVYFSLLCDLPDSDREKTDNDGAIVKNAVDNILRLRRKHGDCFFLFLRDRVYSKKQGCFMAHERKRGAVNALCSFLCNKSDGFSRDSIKPDEVLCGKIKYVFTLDSDTNLAFDCVRKTAGIMLHPNNRPLYDEKKKRVIKGYGIIQPKMVTSLSSANKTAFTGIMCGAGGVDSYSSAGYDLAFSLFGKGVFCGKGMFDKECFYKALCGKNEFQKDIVLSHDAPEGAILRCISTSRITLTDSFPREQMSYNKRRHRWVRGDIQNICFFGKERRNSHNEKIVNGVDFTSKYLMLENIADGMLQIFSLILMLLSLAVKERAVSTMLVTVSVSPYLLPFVYTLVSSLRKAFFYNLGRLFYSKGVYSGIWAELMRTFLALSFIPQSAYVCFDAILRCLYRMCVSHKNTLEWMTAAQSDRESRDGILGYVKKNLLGAFCGVILITCTGNSFVRLVGLAWLSSPFTAYYSGKEKKVEQPVVTVEEKQLLLENIADMWQYFEDNVSKKTNYLPPDNISFYPCEKVSFMTSPTNIGLYLASACVARKSGLLSTKQLEKTCNDTLDTLIKIPKYKGLLYNWYDVSSAQPMKPKFVSSVDEGNYIACLFVLLGALGEYEKEFGDYEGLRKKVQSLIDEADLSLMYNKKRKLFYIGFTVEDDSDITYSKNCYDMLMSETRILSFTAVAQRQVESTHFGSLSRQLAESDRYVGLVSWSGTVFEYFMPAIFLPTVYGSLSFEALRFAQWMNVRCGKEYNERRIFGISESCYNSLDEAGNYRYHAFGNEEIALCVFSRQQVVSPYSSYLMLETDYEKSLENLKNLRDLGMYGKYGFYESCDFERHDAQNNYGIVRCFMSHHLGMSICGAGNLIFDGCVRKFFMSDGKNSSALELLEERIPTEVYIKKRARKYYPMLSKPVLRPEYTLENGTEQAKEPKEITEICDNKNRIQVFVGEETVCCDSYEGKYCGNNTSFEAEWFTAKREPVKIITVNCRQGRKVYLDAVMKKAVLVQTEAGGVVFYLDGKMCFAFGFCIDESGRINQCVCRGDDTKKSGRLFFDEDNKYAGKTEYVFAVGYAKSFEGIYNVRKRILRDREKIKSDAIIFSESLEIDRNKMPDIPECDGNKASFVILTTKSDMLQAAKQAVKLVYTRFSLKEYTVTRLTRMLMDTEKTDEKTRLYICAAFCGYCLSLEENSLRSFIGKNTESYRLVLLCLMKNAECRIKHDGHRHLQYQCLKQLSDICKHAGDEAAYSIVACVLERWKKENM